MGLLRHIHVSRAKQAIVAGMVGMGRALDIQVLAEGVESEAEFAEFIVLGAAGIALFQGYYFAKPDFMALPEIPVFDLMTLALTVVGAA